jgi:hypothetical protein
LIAVQVGASAGVVRDPSRPSAVIVYLPVGPESAETSLYLSVSFFPFRSPIAQRYDEVRMKS